MIKDAQEAPLTYLNKGQTYILSVIDTTPIVPTTFLRKYRTFIRISFENEEHRAEPETCWQIWKDGRGSSEACRHGGKLLAIEYVSPRQGGGSESRRAQIELESASFDGFCVLWTLNPSVGASECSIPIRFHCLSTDFSHLKGVKGLPLRLCAKTEMVLPLRAQSSSFNGSELCFCLVKLFRDHGAERKLSYDVAHVNKVIDKLQQRIGSAEPSMGDFEKRKKGELLAKRPGTVLNKVTKHKSVCPVASDQRAFGATVEDLREKIAAAQDMLYSTRPVSVLYLKGADQDDPDQFPAGLSQRQDLESPVRHEIGDFKFHTSLQPSSSNAVSFNLKSDTTPISSRHSSISLQLRHSNSSRHALRPSPSICRSTSETLSASNHPATGTDGISLLLGSVDPLHPEPYEPYVEPSKFDGSLPSVFVLIRLQSLASTSDKNTMQMDFTLPYTLYNERFKA